jgi:nitrite reductase (NADH) large subunit
VLKLAREKARVVVGRRRIAGLEAAYGLAKAGSKTLLHLMDCLMERQLDAPAARCSSGWWKARALRFCLVQIPTDHREGVVQAVELSDGRIIAADPWSSRQAFVRISRWQRTRVPVNRGIVVDDQLRTAMAMCSRLVNAPNIAAPVTGW